MTPFGLPADTTDTIVRILARHPDVERAVVYGSRALGRHRRGSDIDLVLEGEALTLEDLAAIAGELEESSIPYTVDLSVWHLLDHEPLRDHIRRVGKALFERRVRDRSDSASERP